MKHLLKLLQMTKTFFGVVALLLMKVSPSTQEEGNTRTKINNNNKSVLRQKRRTVIQVDSLNPRQHEHETSTMYHDVEQHEQPKRMRKVVDVPVKLNNVISADDVNNNIHKYNMNKLLSTKEVTSQFVFDRLLADLFAPASSFSFSFSMSMSM
jgi:hypothetical protein